MEAVTAARGQMRHVIEAFDEFVEHGIAAVLEKLPPISLEGRSIHLKNHRVVRPVEPDPVTGEPRFLLPEECARRDIYYALLIRVDVCDGDSLLLENEFLCHLPCMVGSRFGNFDPGLESEGGHFVVGKLYKALVGAEQQQPNSGILVHHAKKGWRVDVRSAHSASRLHVAFNKTVTVEMEKHMKRPVSLLVMLRALGFAGPYASLFDTPAARRPAVAKLVGSLLAEPDTTVQQARAALDAAIAPFRDTPTGHAHAMSVFLLPHLGVTAASWPQKVFFLSKYAVMLLEGVAGTRRPTDRDALDEKRVQTSAALLEERFARAMAGFWRDLRLALYRSVRKCRDLRVSKEFKDAVPSVTRAIRSSMRTGCWGGDHNGMCRDAELAKTKEHFESAPRSTTAYLASTAKINKPRLLDGSMWGFVCPAETPSGDSIGLLKTPAVTCEVTSRADEVYWVEQARANSVPDWDFVSPKLLLNGRIVGRPAPDLETCFARLRLAVRREKPYHATITKKDGDVYVDVSAGRWVRPVFVNHPDLPKVYSKSLAELRELTGLAAAEEIFELFIRTGVVEYISPGTEVYIALSLAELEAEHTHVELHPTFIFGPEGARVPFAGHDMSPRIAFQAEMARQVVAHKRLAELWETTFHEPCYAQYPLCDTLANTSAPTRPDRLERGVGLLNTVMAVMALEENQEDSHVFSQYAVDRGLFTRYTYRTYSDTASPPYFFAGDPKHPKIDLDGCPVPGERISEGDVLFCKRGPGGFCAPVVYREKAPGVVDKVMRAANGEGGVICRVRVRAYRCAVQGDKFASRHGQKGTVGNLRHQEDLPFTSQGIVPDVILNPHALPSRMTIGHLLEMLVGKAGVAASQETLKQHGVDVRALCDATAFLERDYALLGKILRACGYHGKGAETMYCGRTGRQFKVLVFVGICAEQGMKHMVRDKIQARAYGPMDAKTRQPVGGRADNGGLRLGGMEFDVFNAHGAAAALFERLLVSSDGAPVAFCRQCGARAKRTAGLAAQEYRCSTLSCMSFDFDVKLLAVAAMCLLDELRAVGISYCEQSVIKN